MDDIFKYKKSRMKKGFICGFLFFLYLNCGAQKGNYKITYRHCVQYDTTLKLRDTVGLQAVLIGNEKGTNYSFAKQTSVVSINNKNEKTLDQIISSKQPGTFKIKSDATLPDSIGNIVYHSKITDSIFVREKMKNGYVITEEKGVAVKWKIESEKKTIKNHICQKAIAKFRGRDYIAWFTTDIPIVAAPWKFYGLPGLLMSIEDDKEQVKIYIEKIEYPVEEKVPEFVNNGKKISLENYFVFRNEDFKKETAAMQSILDNQEHIKEIIASGEARPIVRTKGALYCIEKRLD